MSIVVADGTIRGASGGVYSLDFGSVIALAESMGAGSNLFIELLPEMEAIIVRSQRRDDAP
jgi:hypothetical protein